MRILKLPDSDKCDPEADNLPTGTTHVIYCYKSGFYDGSGEALVKADGKWYRHSLGHCSCYGPWENMDTKNPLCDRLVDVEHTVSKECWQDLKELVKLALVSGWA
jgi:hypothetical protein